MPAPKTDKALERSRARAEFRKEVVGASSDAQVRIARERGKQRRSVEKVKTSQRVIERQQSEAARTAAYQNRANIQANLKSQQAQQRIQTQEQLAGLQRRERVITGVTKSATSTSTWSTLMLVTALFFGMIILYVIVTNGGQFGNLTGQVGGWIAGLSSNQPLFVRKDEASN